MPRLQGYRERLWWKFYDTHDISEVTARKFFGEENVGDRRRSNMAIAGQTSGEQTFVVMTLYALTPIDERISDYETQLTIGTKPMLPAVTLREWLMGIRLRRPLIIPVRQRFDVTTTWLTPPPGRKFEVQVHIEGLLTRDVA